jgi:hypothetical protein
MRRWRFAVGDGQAAGAARGEFMQSLERQVRNAGECAEADALSASWSRTSCGIYRRSSRLTSGSITAAVHTACCTARIGGHDDHDFRRFAPDLDVKRGAACF